MAELFVNQAKQYAEARPSYHQELCQFIASNTPTRDLVWDVGTGSGQAARSLAGIYNREMSYYPFNNRIKGGLRFIDGRVFRLRQKAWRQQRAAML